MITKHSITQAAFSLPMLGGSITIPVSSAAWMDVGDFVHIRGGGNFIVNAINGTLVTLVLSDLAEMVGPGTIVKNGSSITEGAQSSIKPVQDPSKASSTPLYSGGTGAVTAAEARTNLGIQSMQTGTGTLVLGTATVATATITSSSAVFVQRTSGPTGIATGEIGIMVTSITVGAPGSFIVTAIDKDGNAVVADVCTFNWMVVG